MKLMADAESIRELAADQRGVFSTADLRSILAERHPSAFTRRISALLTHGVLRRFIRGWYVTSDFDLPTLASGVCPGCTVSFDAVLARELLIGPAPVHRLLATRVGPGRTYEGLGVAIEVVCIAAHLDFGIDIIDGVRWATPERATLDALYFHLRGRRYTFDVFSDIAYDRLRRDRLESYLARYRNSKFVRFARCVLELP